MRRLVVLGYDWQDLALADGIMDSDEPFGRVSGCKYRIENGNHVIAAFNCTFVHTGQVLNINQTSIPDEYRPGRTVLSYCPADNGGVALCSVTPDGFIQVEDVDRNGESGEHSVLWIDGYIDYWI